jgi:hypothetical protein
MDNGANAEAQDEKPSGWKRKLAGDAGDGAAGVFEAAGMRARDHTCGGSMGTEISSVVPCEPLFN